MPIKRSDAGWLIASFIGLLTLIISILQWDFSTANPMLHIKAIYVILLVITFAFAAYIVINTKEDKKKGKNKNE
jgi:uncharacterized membrane protein